MKLNEYIARIHDPMLEYATSMTGRLLARYPPPVFRDVNGFMQWRYDNPSVEHAALLFAVRIISAFNAIRCLLISGYALFINRPNLVEYDLPLYALKGALYT